MLNIPVPYEKLLMFQERLGLDEESLRLLDPYRPVFIARKEDFAGHFNNVFQSIPDARLVLDYEQNPGHMQRVWSHWFQRIFSSKLDNDLYAYLWRIGLRHVEVNLDQRFSNLGFSIIRQFCHDVVLPEVGHGSRTLVLQVIDKLMDLCLLVETSAYIEATTRCDIEIIRGIADRVRNPVSVIGGNIRRLQKKVQSDSPAYGVYDTLLSENGRLEHMVSDIRTYFDMLQKDPEIHTIEVRPLLEQCVSALQGKKLFNEVRVEMGLSPDAVMIRADADDMRSMFAHLLENAFEAVDPEKKLVRLSSSVVTEPHEGIRIEIFNTGKPFMNTDMDLLATPFYSTKPSGTGFGIPIIRLALRKNHGKIIFMPLPEQGTSVIVTLPSAGSA